MPAQADRYKKTTATTATVAALTATAATLPNGTTFGATTPLAGADFDRIVKIDRVALVASDAAGGLFSWPNPESTSIVIARVVLDVTTDSTGACTVDVGTTATSAATSSDNLIDGLDVGTAAGIFDNIQNAGTNGKPLQKLAVGKWVNGSRATGAAAGIVGYAYIHYFLI